mmetsp:Transcript_43098/g.100603  ORF Transcript_43098/g.100603 Transcript_43098/m.100603 type:complete len:237 (-) Transcript_43098:4370-5080(-)
MWQLLRVQARGHVFHAFAHGQLTTETKLELLQALDHLVQQCIHVLALLQEDKLVRAFVFRGHATINIVGREALFVHLFQDLVARHLGDGHWCHGSFVITFSAASSIRQHLEHVEDLVAFGGSEIDLRVWMHSEHEWRLRWHCLNVLEVSLVRCRLGRRPGQLALCIWNHVNLVQQLVPHEIQQVLLRHASIPIIHDMSSIHDLTKDVAQVVPWNLHRRRTFQVVVQHLGRVPQVTR